MPAFCSLAPRSTLTIVARSRSKKSMLRNEHAARSRLRALRAQDRDERAAHPTKRRAPNDRRDRWRPFPGWINVVSAWISLGVRPSNGVSEQIQSRADKVLSIVGKRLG